jgi:hypothetical protein
MDLLTHLFVPITVAYVLRPDLFPSVQYFLLGFIGLSPDLDKVVGLQGLFHSVLVLSILGAGLFFCARRLRGKSPYVLLSVALLYSHLLLDFLEGGPILILYPVVDLGVGLYYPAELVLGQEPWSIGIRDFWPVLRSNSPDRGEATYRLFTGYGFLSGLVFTVIYATQTRAEVAFPRRRKDR